MVENKIKKVFFIIGKLEGGGAERVVLTLLRHLDRKRFTPFLVLFEKEGAFLGKVPTDVIILDCERRRAGGGIRWFSNLVDFFRVERPDVALSFMWFSNAVTILSRFLARIPCKVVVTEHSTLLGSREGFFTEIVRKMSILTLYRAADRILSISAAMKRQFVEIFWFPERKIATINNPVEITEILRQAEEKINDWDFQEDLPIVVGMGRLSPEKGFDNLIRAAGIVKIPFLLLLLGEGREERVFRELATHLGINNRVAFTGFLANPFPYLRRSSVFVLSSRYEGFPTALVEAMAIGLPCIATRCPTGPEDIITDDVDGLLAPVENPEGIAQRIELLLAEPSIRARLGKAASERVREFDAPEITRRYEDLLDETTA